MCHIANCRGQQSLEGRGLGIEKPAELDKDDDEFEAYRKRMMLAYRFRPNPLVNISSCFTVATICGNVKIVIYLWINRFFLADTHVVFCDSGWELGRFFVCCRAVYSLAIGCIPFVCLYRKPWRPYIHEHIM